MKKLDGKQKVTVLILLVLSITICNSCAKGELDQSSDENENPCGNHLERVRERREFGVMNGEEEEVNGEEGEVKSEWRKVTGWPEEDEGLEKGGVEPGIDPGFGKTDEGFQGVEGFQTEMDPTNSSDSQLFNSTRKPKSWISNVFHRVFKLREHAKAHKPASGTKKKSKSKLKNAHDQGRLGDDVMMDQLIGKKPNIDDTLKRLSPNDTLRVVGTDFYRSQNCDSMKNIIDPNKQYSKGINASIWRHTIKNDVLDAFGAIDEGPSQNGTSRQSNQEEQNNVETGMGGGGGNDPDLNEPQPESGSPPVWLQVPEESVPKPPFSIDRGEVYPNDLLKQIHHEHQQNKPLSLQQPPSNYPTPIDNTNSEEFIIEDLNCSYGNKKLGQMISPMGYGNTVMVPMNQMKGLKQVSNNTNFNNPQVFIQPLGGGGTQWGNLQPVQEGEKVSVIFPVATGKNQSIVNCGRSGGIGEDQQPRGHQINEEEEDALEILTWSSPPAPVSFALMHTTYLNSFNRANKSKDNFWLSGINCSIDNNDMIRKSQSLLEHIPTARIPISNPDKFRVENYQERRHGLEEWPECRGKPLNKEEEILQTNEEESDIRMKSSKTFSNQEEDGPVGAENMGKKDIYVEKDRAGRSGDGNPYENEDYPTWKRRLAMKKNGYEKEDPVLPCQENNRIQEDDVFDEVNKKAFFSIPFEKNFSKGDGNSMKKLISEKEIMRDHRKWR